MKKFKGLAIAFLFVIGIGVSFQFRERTAMIREISSSPLRGLASDPAFLIQAKKIEAAFRDGTATPAEVEPVFFEGLALLYKTNDLRRALTYLVVHARAKGALGDFAHLPNEAIVETAYPMLESELYSRGLAANGAHRYATWDVLAREQLKKLNAQPTPAGRGVTTGAFKREIAKLAGAKFVEGNEFELLADAPATLNHRVSAIQNARTSLHVLSWAILDDKTGNLVAAELLRAHQRGIEVKVMVDGQVSRKPGYHGAVKKLEDAGVPTIRWKSATNPFYGQHRKLMVVDGEFGYQGGRNFGDAYYHQGAAPKWRDTDMLFRGPIVTDTEKLFVSLWNEQVKLQAKPSSWLAKSPGVVATAGSASGALVNHTPTTSGNDPIYLATLKAIRAAKKSVDISNAYVIETPALKQEILAARGRGVKVRIFTNSAKSVDEPIVTYPILSGLKAYFEAGCEIYLKQGDTTHSKYLVVDGAFSWLGSYNLHPRSLQYEGEMVFLSLDVSFAKAITRDFEQGLAQAKRAASVADLEIPSAPAWPFLTLFFFNQI